MDVGIGAVPQCAKSGTVFFMKQLGAKPFEGGVRFPIWYCKDGDKRDVNGTLVKNFPKNLQERQ